MAILAIVRIRTPHWANAFARRRVEDRLVGDSPLTGSEWLIEFSPSVRDHEVRIEGPTISADDRLAIESSALVALATSDMEAITDACR